MSNLNINSWHFKGKKIVQMTKTELMEVVVYLADELRTERELYIDLETGLASKDEEITS